ncbi:MAG: hypothetical protein COS76_03980 [Candidatus Portnoybacteria bacterium CG06_land_8_20_14_3_00_39_12]|uniref:Uncharacterized protein n=1 Tax=Candidatus Portnoybacteria bacterium CG06_land_8_20_14_3_00_39_12 TaxID=1974809 RepID=A0A2M7AW39_9BACT|nr:MAG: hypothetical protein COS76_03980 [Candidatus Portnoybacteria bacterium CG06_land_8_20_14_3_00_39_12]
MLAMAHAELMQFANVFPAISDIESTALQQIRPQPIRRITKLVITMIAEDAEMVTGDKKFIEEVIAKHEIRPIAAEWHFLEFENMQLPFAGPSDP